MNHQELVLDTLRQMGKAAAKALQEEAPALSDDGVVARGHHLPLFAAAAARCNMLQRPVGFVCRTAAGRAVRLLQTYDSAVYTQEPEELPAQWGFCHTTDPACALPFLSVATSPYMEGHCCVWEGRVWRSGQDNNVWAPGTTGVNWEDVGPAEEENV